MRRWTTLALIAAALAGGGAFAVRHHRAVAEAALQTLRHEGLAAHAVGNDATAVARLDRYFAAHEPDVEALLAFAAARANVEMPDGSHFHRAEQALLRAERLAPADAAVRRALLDLLPKTGDTNTLDRVADEALATHPADPRGLRARMAARLQQDRPQDALDAALACTKTDPLDFDAHLTVLQLMNRLGRPAAAMAAYAESAFAPTDARRLMLRAAAAVPSDRKHAVATLRGVVSMVAGDAELTRQTVALFDLLSRPDLSRDLLGLAAARTNDVGLARTYARRLWQSGDLHRLAEGAPPLDGKDPLLVGLRAAALYRTDRSADARDRVASLARRHDRVSMAWAAALPAYFESPVSIAMLQKSVDACPADAILHELLADALADAGEPTLASPHYGTAARLESAWPAPLLGQAVALVAVGETAAAASVAQSAYDRQPGVDAAVELIGIRFAAYDRTNDPAAADDLLAAVTGVQSARPGEPRTLAVRARLLARLGRTAAAAASDGPAVVPQASSVTALTPAEIETRRRLAGDGGRQWRLALAKVQADSADGGSVFDAVTTLGDLVYETPRCTPPRLALAHALERAGNAIGAAEHLKIAVANDPNNPEPLIDLVRLLRRQNRPADAIEVLRRAGQITAPPARIKAAVAALTADAADVVSADTN